MVDAARLRAEMAKKGATGVTMAAVIGKKPKTFYRKLKQGKFACTEIGRMVRYLEPDRPEEIFFAKEVT